MRIFIPYNRQYVIDTYQCGPEHVSYVEDVVLRFLLKRLVKSNYVDHIDIYSKDIKGCEGLHSNKLRFIPSISNESDSSEKILQDYLSITRSREPLVLYNMMFPFTDIGKVYESFQAVASGDFQSATGVLSKGIVWNGNTTHAGSEFSVTPGQDDLHSSLDVGSFCVLKPDHILKGLRRTTPPVKLVPLCSHELVNMRSEHDKKLYRLIITSGLVL